MATIWDKIKQSYSDIVSKADRDKQKPGFQITGPRTRNDKSFFQDIKEIQRANLQAARDLPSMRGPTGLTLKESIGMAKREAPRVIGQVHRRFLPEKVARPASQIMTFPTQVSLGGLGRMSTGASEMASGMLERKPLRTLKGSAQSLYGVGTIVAPFKPTFQAANLGLAAFPDTGIGEFSKGYMSGMSAGEVERQDKFTVPGFLGEVVGFTQHPTNKKLFELTEAIMPAGKFWESAKNKELKRWFTVTASRGGVEQIMMDLENLPSGDLTLGEKVLWLSKNFGLGARQEVVGRMALDSTGKGFELIRGTESYKFTAKQINKLWKSLGDLRRRMTVPVKGPVDEKTGERVVNPMWKVKLGIDKKPRKIDEFKSTIGGEEPVLIKDTLEKRFQEIKSKSKKTDAELIDEYRKAFDTWGRNQFGKDFDSKQWTDNFDEMVRFTGGIESFGRKFDAYSKQFLGTKEGGLKFARELRGGKGYQEDPGYLKAVYGEEPKLEAETDITKTKKAIDAQKTLDQKNEYLAKRMEVDPLTIQNLVKQGYTHEQIYREWQSVKGEPKIKAKPKVTPRTTIKQTPIDKQPGEIKQIEEMVAKNRTTLEKLGEDIESGVKSKEQKAVTDFYNKYKKIAEENYGIKIGEEKNYIFRVDDARAEEIIKEAQNPDTFGSILSQPTFAYHRTGIDTEYNLSRKNLEAYRADAIRNVNATPEQKADIKFAAEIRKELSGMTEEGKIGGFSLTEKIDQKIKSGDIKQENPKTYNKFNDLDKWNRSVDDRASVKNTSKEFYDDFIYPFKQHKIRLQNFIFDINNTPKAGLYDKYLSEIGFMGKNKFDRLSEADLKMSMIKKYYGRSKAIAVDEFKTNAKNGVFEKIGLKKLVDDIFNEYVGTDIKQINRLEKISRIIRQTTSRGTLGLNVTSAINNIFETKRVFSLIDRKNLSKGFEILRNTDRPLTVKYGVDSKAGTNTFRNKSKAELASKLKKMDDVLFWMFDKTETYKDNLMLAGFESQGISKGLEGEDLTKYVIQKFDQYAIKYGIGQDVKAFKSPLVKTIFQYAHYFIKDSTILADKIAQAAGKDKGARSYLTKYAAITIAQALAMKSIIGMWGFGNTTSTPLDVAQDISEKKTPFLSPITQLIINLGNLAFKKDMTDYEKEKAITESQKTARLAIPASNQLISKSGVIPFISNENAYLQARKRGYYQTQYGENKGSVAGLVSTDPASTIKGTLFGSSYDPKRQEYYKKLKAGSFPSLSAKQTAKFKSLNKESAELYYNLIQSSDQERVSTKVKDDMETMSYQEVLDKYPDVGNYYVAETIYSEWNNISKKDVAAKNAVIDKWKEKGYTNQEIQDNIVTLSQLDTAGLAKTDRNMLVLSKEAKAIEIIKRFKALSSNDRKRELLTLYKQYGILDQETQNYIISIGGIK